MDGAHIIFISIALFSFLFGLYIFYNPQRTIDWQKKFYAGINWRVEPISLPKEIRNTRIMGIFLIGFVIAMSLYAFLNK